MARNQRTSIVSGFLIIVVMAGLGGCKVGPNFKPPEPQVPETWIEPPAPAPEMNLAQWWTQFGDEKLTSLIEEALANNLDLKAAEARVRQARATRGIVFSAIGPSVDATGSFQRSQPPGNPATGFHPTTNQYQAGFDASWEVDIFGGIRREIEAADADVAAAEESRRDIWVTVAAETASLYIDLRSFQDRIEIAKRNLKAQQTTAAVTRKRFEGEFSSGLDVANAEAQMFTTQSVIPLLEASARQTIYSLSILLGREPGALLEELAPIGPVPTAAAGVPLGVPSDLIRRRPDIRRAEAQIHAATARIGAAEADFFPKFNVTSSIGYGSTHSNTWFDSISRFWSLGPGVTWQIFDTGRIISNVDLQKFLQEETVITYRQTVLTALQDVENALIASAKEKEHYDSLKLASESNRKAVDLSTKLYTEGLTEFLNVLDSQRSLYVTEDAAAQSRRNLSSDLVALYKALGGGWEEDIPTK
jgi:outer membrane protein, multidrug efflux system